jgi:hypothetical protein
MSTVISYGGYSFPHPYPFLAIDHEPIIISGVLDHSVITASLIGEFTGCNFTTLKIQKDRLISGLATGFQTLTVGEKTYQYAKPISANFSSSNIKNRLPYSIEFTIQNDTDFSTFYGVRDPVDTWSYSEQEDRTVSATHTVSAYGVKITGDSLTNARNFVNSRLDGFDATYSVMLSGSSPILISKSEDVDRASNFYSVTENWKYSLSLNGYDKSGAIVRADTSLNYNEDGTLNVSVKGTIDGGISGTVNEGLFTKEQATEFARNALLNSKANFELSLYGEVVQEPRTYSYEYNSGSNLISFNYDFGDASETILDEVIHKYTTSVNASKDSPIISASVNGTVSYNKINNPNTGQTPEQEYRFTKVNQYFNSINPFAIASEGYGEFKVANVFQGSSQYSNYNLDASVVSFNITKDPFSASINYDYSYNNSIDYFSGLLLNPSVSIKTDIEHIKYAITPTIDNSFAIQNLYTTNKRVSVSVQGDVPENKNMQTALRIVSGYIQQYASPNGFLIQNDVATGNRNISVNKTFFFK